MEEIQAVTQEQLSKIRQKFNDKVAAEAPGFHPRDLKRVKDDDLWLRRFIAHGEGEVDAGFTMLYDCCKWRKEFGTNDLDDSKFPRDMLEKGTLFIRNKDKWGKKLLIFKAKLHTKGSVDMDLLQKYTVYTFEKIERESKSDQISVIFDMAGTGWNNMDMDFVRFFIMLLKTYYPYFVNYMIIFEMPWLLNAAWKIIKSWLPAKFVDRVKFQDKKTLKEFIDPDNQLAEWGGTDNYVYKYEPYSNNNNNDDSVSRNQPQKASLISPTTPRADGDGGRQLHQIEYDDDQIISRETSPMVGDSSSPQQNSLAEVSEQIQFRPHPESDTQYTAQLQVKHLGKNDINLMVKIKTTAPERYRVKPIVFVLHPRAKGVVNIETHSGVSAVTMTRDRFQVQVVEIPSNLRKNSRENASDGGDLGQTFREVVRTGGTSETYKVLVSVEKRAGDTGPGGTIGLNDDRLKRGLEQLEKQVANAVGKEVGDKIDKMQRLIYLAALAVIVFFLLCTIVIVYSSSRSCSCAPLTEAAQACIGRP